MYVKRNYGFWMTLNWTKKPFIAGTLYGLSIALVSYYFKIIIAIPWQPISILGIAVAFYLGFKNNSSYDRTWEARKIWGGIVNSSRTFGAATVAFVQGDKSIDVQREIIYRHLAWVTALRHQLRLSRPWEHLELRLNKRYVPTICEDYNSKLEKELLCFIDKNECDEVMHSSNTATQIMKNQSKRLQELKDQSYYDDFRHMEMHHLVTSFYSEQGKAERIKNFPFPRQYASTALWLTMVFSVFAPLGLMDVFNDIHAPVFWISPFISGLIIWVFFLMEKIGDYSENPFEGNPNDVPITSISRGIEIDLREMINDKDIPVPLEDENGFLM